MILKVYLLDTRSAISTAAHTQLINTNPSTINTNHYHHHHHQQRSPPPPCPPLACLAPKRTARPKGFIVDFYHYINHKTSDYICRKWCNPASLDGSAPNLVIVEKDRDGNNYYKRAFNTQVSNHQIVNLLSNHQYCRHVNSSRV